MAIFTYMGEEFAYAEEFPAFEYAEFCEALADGEDSESARATGVALSFAVACVAAKDRARFRRLSRKNRAKVDDWMRVGAGWTVEEAERPTGLPSDSSDGQSDTVEKSASQPVASVTSLTEQRPVRGDAALAVARSRTA
ncbi:MAG TPA: hypothetical protein VFH56_02115 [Acidimicrobiales bacterium]|nr:hypothetical protein [Acidimicrobiales bacterium]